MTEPAKAPDATIQPVAQWFEQPIFISSTFRDMQAERDVLHDTVFPKQKKRLAKYHRALASTAAQPVGLPHKIPRRARLQPCLWNGQFGTSTHGFVQTPTTVPGGGQT